MGRIKFSCKFLCYTKACFSYLLIFHHQCASTLDNIEEWRRELTLFMRNEDQQEIVSRDKKDRRDFKHLSALATRMGLHRQVICSHFYVLAFIAFFALSKLYDLFFSCSHQYAKVIVVSKVPLPNYRSDLDDKRPQREVFLLDTSHL